MAETKQIPVRLLTIDHKNIDKVKKVMRGENIPEHQITRTEAIRFALDRVANGEKK